MSLFAELDAMATETSGAIFSDDGLYRYRLWRRWGHGRRLIWVMLNPSTADAHMDDPTIRRCVGYARREGFAGIEVLNLYALRATRPVHLLDHPDPEGPENTDHWDRVIDEYGPATLAVAAWGSLDLRRLPPSRALDAWSIASRGRWVCLGRTASGAPRHPLYVRADQAFEPFGRTRDEA